MSTHEERLAYMRHESAMLQRSRESVLAEIDEAIATHRPITYPQPGSSGSTRVDGGLTVAAAAKGIQPEPPTGALGTDECQATNNTKQSPAAPSRSIGAAGSSARKRTAAELVPVPMSPADAALNYADYAARRGDGGYPDLWVRKFPDQSAGDRLIGCDSQMGTGTRPELCLQILANEVRRLRFLTNRNALT